MKFKQYIKALDSAPRGYRNLPLEEIRIAIFEGDIVITHHTIPPFIWRNKKWESLL